MPAADDIRRWSNELATDPQSLAFADLAEALRQQGDLETAERLAVRGLERHPTHGPALSVLARIAEARGDLNAASAFWERARLYNPTPTTGAANGSVPSPRTNGHADTPVAPQTRLTGASYPTASYAAIPSFSASIATPPSRQEVVRSLVADADGLLLASPQPSDDMAVLEAMAAAVAGVGDDAARAMKHLNLGAWRWCSKPAAIRSRWRPHPPVRSPYSVWRRTCRLDACVRCCAWPRLAPRLTASDGDDHAAIRSRRR
jgi:tetratricopeptide (TPR) repeat protein